jgi:hypothetical protein
VWGEWFAGLIDEVRIYDRALSVSEIQADMNTPIETAANGAAILATGTELSAASSIVLPEDLRFHLAVDAMASAKAASALNQATIDRAFEAVRTSDQATVAAQIKILNRRASRMASLPKSGASVTSPSRGDLLCLPNRHTLYDSAHGSVQMRRLDAALKADRQIGENLSFSDALDCVFDELERASASRGA